MKKIFLLIASTTCIMMSGMSQNLITNGDFANGDTMFTVSPNLPEVCACQGQSYCVVPNSGSDKCAWTFSTTPSPSLDPFMVIDGFSSTPADNLIWSQTVPVTFNTAYSFGFNVMSVYDNRNPNLEIRINGDVISTITSDQILLGTWRYLTASWVSDNATTFAIIEIRQLPPYGGGGYDFGIDDITLVPGCQGGEVFADFDYDYNPCTGVVHFTSLDSRATSWFWEFENGATSTLQNPTYAYNNPPLPTGSNGPGVFLLVESVGGCVAAVHASDLYFYRENAGNITISGGSETYCPGEVITLTATSSVYPDYDRFAWDVSELGNIVSQNGQDVNILITSNNGGNVFVTTDNNCGSTGNTFVNSQLCCTDSKLTALSIYSTSPTPDYNYTNINESAIYNGASLYCNDFSQLNRGASTMDIYGNYYYLDGNNLFIVEEATCTKLKTNISGTGLAFDAGGYNTHMEPEYNATGISWVLSKNSNDMYALQEVTPNFVNANAPQNPVTEPSHITQTIQIGNFPPVAGSSTFNPRTGMYYYVLDESGVPPTNDPNRVRPKLGTVVAVNIYNGNVRTFVVNDMDGVYNDGTVPSFTPVLQELEYNPTTGEIVATVQHYVEEEREIVIEPETGGPNGNIEPILTNGGMGGTLEGGPNDRITTRTITIVVASTDVITFPIPEVGRRATNAHIVVSKVSFDAYSSSTLDVTAQRYLLTSSDGLYLYQVDIANETFTLQTGNNLFNGKETRRIYEIEYANCGESTTGARPAISSTEDASNDNIPMFEVSVQPNPSNTGRFSVIVETNSNEDLTSVEVLDMYGKIVRSEKNIISTVQFDIVGLAKGMYYVRITNAHQSELKKVIYQ